MADNSFGIKELNLVGSGTPKIESPNNINLNAVNVAISTNATVGGTLDVDGHTELDGVNVSGVCTATSFVKSGGTSSQYLMADGSTSTGGSTTINNNADNRVITGSNSANTLEAESSLTYDGTTLTASSFSGGGNDIVTSRWTLGANGSSDYTFTGPGGLSGTADPKLYLARGQTYEFVNNSGGSHPFQIQTSLGAAYNTGVTNNNASSGTIKFEVPFSAPNTLQYKCTNHGSMGNTIIIYPDLSP